MSTKVKVDLQYWYHQSVSPMNFGRIFIYFGFISPVRDLPTGSGQNVLAPTLTPCLILFSPQHFYLCLFAGCYLDGAAGLRFYAASSRTLRWRLDQSGAFWKRMCRLKGQETLQSLNPAKASPPTTTTSSAHSAMGTLQRRGRAEGQETDWSAEAPASSHNAPTDPPQRRGRARGAWTVFVCLLNCWIGWVIDRLQCWGVLFLRCF